MVEPLSVEDYEEEEADLGNNWRTEDNREENTLANGESSAVTFHSLISPKSTARQLLSERVVLELTNMAEKLEQETKRRIELEQVVRDIQEQFKQNKKREPFTNTHTT